MYTPQLSFLYCYCGHYYQSLTGGIPSKHSLPADLQVQVSVSLYLKHSTWAMAVLPTYHAQKTQNSTQRHRNKKNLSNARQGQSLQTKPSCSFRRALDYCAVQNSLFSKWPPSRENIRETLAEPSQCMFLIYKLIYREKEREGERERERARDR